MLTKSNADFPHEHARSRAFRWGEDGIAGVSDTHGLQNIAFAFWNEEESVLSSQYPTPKLIISSDYLKERLFGLSNPQGNHGESIKEAHFHVDNTPTVRPCRLRLLSSQLTILAFVYETSLQVPPTKIPI
jgi:hypothetical protein